MPGSARDRPGIGSRGRARLCGREVFWSGAPQKTARQDSGFRGGVWRAAGRGRGAGDEGGGLLRERLLAIVDALLDFAHHVGSFRRVVLILDAGGELVLLLLHQLQNVFERSFTLSPRHVGSSAARSGLRGRAAWAFAVLEVQTGDPLVVLLDHRHRRLAVYAKEIGR